MSATVKRLNTLDPRFHIRDIIKDSKMLHALYKAGYGANRIHHNLVLSKAKSKDHCFKIVKDYGCALSVSDQGISFMSAGSYDNSCRILINVGPNLKVYQKIGSISGLRTSFFVGEYWAYNPLAPENTRFGYRTQKSEKTARIRVDKFIEDVKARARPLARKALFERILELQDEVSHQIKFVGTEITIEPQDQIFNSYHRHPSLYLDHSFIGAIDNLRYAARLTPTEDFEKHFKIAAYSIIMEVFDPINWRDDAVTNSFSENWRRRSPQGKIDHLLKKEMLTYSQLVNRLALKLVWFYRRLIRDPRHVYFWNPKYDGIENIASTL